MSCHCLFKYPLDSLSAGTRGALKAQFALSREKPKSRQYDIATDQPIIAEAVTG
jgi:hypothetical protein